jgi:hypothetical protein
MLPVNKCGKKGRRTFHPEGKNSSICYFHTNLIVLKLSLHYPSFFAAAAKGFKHPIVILMLLHTATRAACDFDFAPFCLLCSAFCVSGEIQ